MWNEVPMRQIPGGSHDEQTWVSADGRVVPRKYDPWHDIFEWGSERAVRAADDGALTVDVHDCASRRHVRLARAIALAWLGCPDLLASRRHATQVDDPGSLEAANLAWRVPGATRGLRARRLPKPEDPTAPSRGWRPLKHIWTSKNGDRIRRVDFTMSRQYLMTRDGWVYSAGAGASTRGHVGPDGTRWVALHDEGLARVDDCVWYTFGEGAPLRAPPHPSDQVVATLDALRTGLTLAEWKARDGVKPGTLWMRLFTCAREAPWEAAQECWRLVPGAVRRDVEGRRGAPGETVSEQLARLRADADQSSVLSLATDTDVYGMLHLARALHRREALRLE